jgi:hypothetical protein
MWRESGGGGEADDLVPGGEWVFISCRYWAAVSRWRRGRKWGDIPLHADRNRWAPPGEANFFIARSRCRVGWWEFSALLFRYFDRGCSTLRVSRRWATP